MKELAGVVFALLCVSSYASSLDAKALEFIEARNFMAEKIVEGDDTAAEKANEKMKSKLGQLKFSKKKCPVCKGVNPFIVKEPKRGQNDGQINVTKMRGEHRVKCPVCKSRGYLISANDVDEVILALKKAERKLILKGQSKGLVLTNNVFLTTSSVEKLSPEIKDVISLTLGEPCRKCYFTGIENCRKCKGDSYDKCRNSGCKSGWFEHKYKNNTSKTKRPPTYTICEVCNGTAKVLCEECEGRNVKECRSCRGEGVIHKKKRH